MGAMVTKRHKKIWGYKKNLGGTDYNCPNSTVQLKWIHFKKVNCISTK